MSVFDHYTGGEPIGMDHPLFMARMQARIDAAYAAESGVPLADALRATRLRMQQLFGHVPLAKIDAVVVEVFAEYEVARGNAARPPGSLP